MNTKDICLKYGKSARTVEDWRHGYRWKNGIRVYFFDDKGKLECVWDDKLQTMSYDEERVQNWVNRLEKHGKIRKTAS